MCRKKTIVSEERGNVFHVDHVAYRKDEWYLYNQLQTTFVTTTFPFFLLDKNNRERKKKREDKNTCEYERELLQKLSKYGCTNIISL